MSLCMNVTCVCVRAEARSHGRKTGAPVTKKNQPLNIQVEKFVSLNYLFGTKRKTLLVFKLTCFEREKEKKKNKAAGFLSIFHLCEHAAVYLTLKKLIFIYGDYFSSFGNKLTVR